MQFEVVKSRLSIDGRFAHRDEPRSRETAFWTRIWFLPVQVALSLWAIGPISLFASTPAPNVVFFMADDVGVGDYSAYDDLTELGATSKVPTPTLDRLAQEGLTFSQARSTTSLCAPTRYATLTGNNTWRANKETGAWTLHEVSNILPGQQTVGDLMQAAGYRTGFFGKMHLGGRLYKKNTNNFIVPNATNLDQIDFQRPFDGGMLQHGFDYSLELPNGVQGVPYSFFENDLAVQIDLLGNTTPVTNVSQVQHWIEGNYNLDTTVIRGDGWGTVDWNTRNVGQALTQNAVRFVRDAVDNHSTDPFFLYYMSEAIHTPYVPPALFEVDLNGDGDRSDAGESTTIDGLVGPGLGSEQMQMVNTGDAALGALVKQLEETDDPRNPGHKLINNTLIIFTADNGGIGKDSFFGKPDLTDYGHDSSGGLKGAKARKDEGGLRVPFVAKWAGHIEEGSVSDQLVGTHDLMATLAGLTGQSLASDQANDSFNLLSVILGHQSDVDPVRDHLITQHTGGSDPIRANIYYENDWKLIVDWNDLVAPNIMALFDLSTDPRETSDLKDSTDPIVQQLLADLYSNYLTVRNANRTAPVLTQLSADFNADGIVSIDDRNNWDEGYGIGADAYFMNGDADRDGDVEGADFLAWQRSIESIFPGDIDQDGDGDGKEFLDWKINFADPAESSSPTNPVPEPPMLWGSVCCLLFFSSNWRSRQRKDGTLKC